MKNPHYEKLASIIKKYVFLEDIDHQKRNANSPTLLTQKKSNNRKLLINKSCQ